MTKMPNLVIGSANLNLVFCLLFNTIIYSVTNK